MGMFNDASRYIDNIFTIENPEFEKHIPVILPPELQLSKASTSKQNRESTEGCLKCLVRKNNDMFGKRIVLNKLNICKSQMRRDQVSGGVSIPCLHVTPVERRNSLFVYSRPFMAGAASQAGDAGSSRAPGLTFGLEGSVNVHRGFLLLVPQWRWIGSFVFYTWI